MVGYSPLINSRRIRNCTVGPIGHDVRDTDSLPSRAITVYHPITISIPSIPIAVYLHTDVGRQYRSVAHGHLVIEKTAVKCTVSLPVRPDDIVPYHVPIPDNHCSKSPLISFL